MMEHGHGSYFPASSLDPYTRLLASLADLVTKARQSLHRTSWGSFILFLIIGFILLGIWAVLFTTSILWAPILFVMLCTYSVTASYRFAVTYGGSGVRTIRNKTQIWGRMVIDVVQTTWHRHVGHNHSHEESYARAERDLAMKDPGFMRALFEALPGVDPEKALERVDALPNFSLAFPGDVRGAGGSRGSYSRGSSAVWDEVFEEGEEGIGGGCLSPIEELFAKGLFERLEDDSLEEQASWQAGRAFVPVRYHDEPEASSGVAAASAGPQRSLNAAMEAEAEAEAQRRRRSESESAEGDLGWRVEERGEGGVLRPRARRPFGVRGEE